MCAIEVSGISKHCTEEILVLFFENKKRSGGGTIEEIFIDLEQLVAVITFESDEGERVFCSLKVIKLIRFS